MERGRLQNEAGTAEVNLFACRYNLCSLVSCPSEEGREPPRELTPTLSHVSPVSPPIEEERVPVSLLMPRSNSCSPVSVQREEGREPPRDVPHSQRFVSAPRPPIDAGTLPPPRLAILPEQEVLRKSNLVTLSTPLTLPHPTPVQAPLPVLQGSPCWHQFCSCPCPDAGTVLKKSHKTRPSGLEDKGHTAVSEASLLRPG